jgi:hypothetical protein
MAQITQITVPAGLLASTGELDEQEARELQAYVASATSNATTVNDMQPYTENALHLFFEQRRRTRTWAIGCALAGAVLGGFMGYYVGKPSKGR